MFFENSPLEKYIVSRLKKNNFNINSTVDDIYNKYPFFRKRDLRDVVARITEKIAAKEGLSGFWIKINGSWNLVSKDEIKALYLQLPETSRSQTNVGRGNRYNLVPQGRDPDRYEPPSKQIKILDEEKEKIQDIYERMYRKYKNEIKELSNEEINRILLQELATLGYGIEDIKKIKLY